MYIDGDFYDEPIEINRVSEIKNRIIKTCELLAVAAAALKKTEAAEKVCNGQCAVIGCSGNGLSDIEGGESYCRGRYDLHERMLELRHEIRGIKERLSDLLEELSYTVAVVNGRPI